MKNLVNEVLKTPARYVVMTGGEPMIAKQVRELLSALRSEGMHITIETAGTIAPEGIDCDLASISPKLANSTPDIKALNAAWVQRHEQARFNPEVLRAWMNAYEFQLKFVVTQMDDLMEIEKVIDAIALPIEPSNILLMPEGRTAEAIYALAPSLVEWCKVRGWRYCARLHIDLFGNKRGT